ncbi:MAG: hypothetical protein ACXVA9_03810 [Bdellovibrionales bacterium]
MKHIIARVAALTTIAGLIVGCGSNGTSYSLLSTGQSFKQAKVNAKIDMLWVVDNSGSMQPLQQNMTSNFNAFISQFVTKGYDFHLGVTSSEAYLSGPAPFNNTPAKAKFSDGVTTHTGIFDIIPGTANLISTFVTNASLGANGSGDERVFSSFKAALDSPLNVGFLRPDSFLAVIILSDEDDFSDPARREYSWTFSGGIADHSYTNPGLQTVDSYVNYLDTLTNTTGAFRRYSVSAITVNNAACLTQYRQSSPGAIIGQRYLDIAGKTDGVIGSVCDASYAPALTAIQNRIIELGTQFYLSATPVVESIHVVVNGIVVPQDPTNGWSYNSAANSIVFHGTAIPAAESDINVSFDPAKLTF